METKWFLFLVLFGMFISASFGADSAKRMVKLCEKENFKGECTTVQVPAKGCASLPNKYDNWASSIDVMNYCFRIYEDKNCLGASIGIDSGSSYQRKLSDADFNKKVSSISQCFLKNPTTGRKQRSTPRLDFFVDRATFGFLAWRPRDTSNLGNSPVRYYQRDPVSHKTEHMEALIEQRHLGTGGDATARMRMYVHGLGRASDQAGHILAKNLGGPGNDERNFFPQNAHINQGAWSQVERTVKELVEEFGSIKFNVNLNYGNPQERTRPDSIVYRIAKGSNDEVLLMDDMINP